MDVDCRFCGLPVDRDGGASIELADGHLAHRDCVAAPTNEEQAAGAASAAQVDYQRARLRSPTSGGG
jgi:hypothetical protein